MAKIRLTSPTFDASAKTITHALFSDVGLGGIQLIINVTDNVIIYQFSDPTKGGSLAGDILTLDFDTTAMDDTDQLMVLVEDGVAYPLPTGASTEAKQDTLITAVDGLEALLGTIDADTGAILTAVDGIEALLTTIESNQDAQTAILADIETAVDGLEATNATIAGAVSGTEMQVDVVAALPAGNNNIGDVDVATLPGVQFQDVYVTGQGSQTALNQNVVLASAGTGSYDTLNGTTGISFRTVSLHIVPDAGTVTAGVITFEGSNDNFASTAAPLFLSDAVNVTAIPVSTVTLAANTPRYFTGAIPFRYFRARISTGITGTTTGVQCFSVFSPIPFSSPRLTVSQATAASLNANVSGTVATTMAANATTTPAKARDGAAGANDTGIPAFFVRRDTPAAVTSAVGDYEPPQISANGEQWVRSLVEVADDGAVTLGTQRGNLIEGVAVAMDGTDPLAVSAEGDAALLRSDPNRILLVNQTHPRFFRASVDYASAQTNATVVAAPGAGLSLYITDIVISNGATAGKIQLLDGSGGSVILTDYVAITGGLTETGKRNPYKLTANTALVITSTSVTTHSVTVTGYIAA